MDGSQATLKALEARPVFRAELDSQLKRFPVGALVNHIWSVAGDDDRDDVDNTFLQPFLAKGIAGGWTLTGNFEASYNWEAEKWTVPFNFVVSKVTRMGSRPISFAGGARYYFETPGEGPDWGLRAVVTLLFPHG